MGDGRVYTDEIKLGDDKIKEAAIGHQHKSSNAGYGDHVHGIRGDMLPKKSFGINKPTIVQGNHGAACIQRGCITTDIP